MTLTKADLVDRIYNKCEVLTKSDAVRAIDILLEIIKQRLDLGDDVLVSSFGKFSVRDKKARRGRNPETGKDMILPPRRVVTFRCSGVLRKKINEKTRKTT